MTGVFRQFSAVVLILSLVLGTVGVGVRASSMNAKMASIALSDMSGQGSCNDCAGSKSGVPVNVCSMYCVGMAAVFPETVTIDGVAGEIRQYLTPRLLAGHHVSPDPYPPRSVVLS
ncbi:MAG: hypothetical protein IH582_07715 [Afipia sp.]|nr:hypothetical protein [Afipia sp.]